MELIVRRDGEVHRVGLERRDDDAWEIVIGERRFRVDSTDGAGTVRSLLVDGRQYEVSVRRDAAGRYRVSAAGEVHEVEVLDPLAYEATKNLAEGALKGPHKVAAYMPGRVVAVLVEEGAEVEAGHGLVVLEAMKMENEIAAEAAGTVRRVFVTAGQAVEAGDPLFEIE